MLWIDPYPTRLPRLDDFRRNTCRFDVTPAERGISVVVPRSFPLEPLPILNMLNPILFWKKLVVEILQRLGNDHASVVLGIGKPSKLALMLLDHLNVRTSFYDAMDDFPAFYSGLSRLMMARVEKDIAQRTDSLFASSHALVRKFNQYGLEVEYAPNACVDPASLRQTKPATKRVQKRRVVVLGYIGTIASWFDWKLIMMLATSRNDIEIHIHGSLHTRTPLTPPNVRFFPVCPQDRVYDVLETFDVGLIPFRKNSLTASVDPVKYYEYLAAGKAVISTDFGEMVYHSGYPGVFVCKSREMFLDAVDYALDHQFNEQERLQFIVANSWQVRFSSLAARLMK